jgi:hypothetical protein
MNLAERLLKAEVLTQEQLARALDRQRLYRGFLAKHLLDLNLIDPEVLGRFVSPYPPAPQTFAELGLPETLLAQLMLKHCFFREAVTSKDMAEALKIPEHLVESLINYLKSQKCLDIRPRDVLRPEPGHLAVEIHYNLSDLGKRRAEQFMEMNNYVGPAPVPLKDYWDWVEAQTVQAVEVSEVRLKEVFADYVVPDDLFYKVGPAIISGRAVFLFGPSGNGKTLIARCIGEAFEDAVYIPYALYVHGQVIRMFDEVNHKPVYLPPDAPRHDGRWILCRRPVVITGGEMTEESLELQFNPVLKYYDAPHQLRANNGVFIIDDFGRQKISPRGLLNRWMHPLESRQDFLTLHTGQQFSVPFDMLIIFCTNLDPFSLADAAFLRRIRHKIYLGHVSPEDYIEIFRRVCAQHGIGFNEEIVRDMMGRHYFQASRALDACHPRDLVDNLIDLSRFMGRQPQLTAEDLDYAFRSYFVKSMGVMDHDTMPDQPKPMI